MATINRFFIKNFKGAADVEIHFSNRISTPIVTLIGLNESGKTTILEAIASFLSGDTSVSSLFEGPAPTGTDAFIPLDQKAAFTGAVQIGAHIDIDDDDLQDVINTIDELGYEIDQSSFPRKAIITREYRFKDSAPQPLWNSWSLSFHVKKQRARKFVLCDDKDQITVTQDQKPKDIWLRTIAAIRSRLPTIAYFPTFLVNTPTKVYLTEHNDEQPLNRYYRQVLQEVLDTLQPSLSLTTHVTDRIKAVKEADGTTHWVNAIISGPVKSTIDAVFQKISAAVTREVLGSWENVFGRKVAAKAIVIEWHIDTQKDDLPYATISVTDGDSKYAIDQRSLGFRWFFSFLLFTSFKRKTGRSTIFLFDEPAANLHAKAQSELLKSFSKITTGNNRIIYSTHSHHMINPKWLSGAYIVENKAVDYDSDDAFGLTTRPTDVAATNYRQFVSHHPTRTSYFQPVIEQLQYVSPEVLGTAPFLLVEGITDYFALKYVYDRQATPTFRLMPGVGSGACGPQIGAMIGRGERFLILLDDDATGRREAHKYREDWLLTQHDVITLADVASKFSGMALEKLLSRETKAAIGDRVEKKSPSKKEIGWFLSELCADPNAKNPFDRETQDNLELVLAHARKLLV